MPQEAFSRIALVEDAGFITRPHTTASTAKSAANATGLVEALRHWQVLMGTRTQLRHSLSVYLR